MSCLVTSEGSSNQAGQDIDKDKTGPESEGENEKLKTGEWHISH